MKKGKTVSGVGGHRILTCFPDFQIKKLWKLVAGVGFESRSRMGGIMSLNKLLEANSTFLTF